MIIPFDRALFDCIAKRQEEMEKKLIEWALISSGSNHLAGLEKMRNALKTAFSPLCDHVEEIDLPNTSAKALLFKKRANASLKLLLSGHMDTVFDKNHSFKKVEYIDKDTLRGPGVADMKGGLVIACFLLQALEATPWKEAIGWEVLITPDEETGSLHSASLIEKCAKRTHLALVFEPTLSDGSMISKRKGSLSYKINVRGIAAHAGREPEKGKNAISALARLIAMVEDTMARKKDLSLTFGTITGGIAVNIVPDSASCQVNIRSFSSEDLKEAFEHIENCSRAVSEKMGVGITFIFEKLTSRPPKLVDEKTLQVMRLMETAAAELHIPLQWKATGGVSDGNLLAATGLPTLDACGATGGGLHTEQEFIFLPSLTQKTQLLSLFLHKLIESEELCKNLC